MKTRDLMATMWIGWVIVAVTFGLVTAGVLFDNRQLRLEVRELRGELDARSTEATVLETERSMIEGDLAAQRRRVEALSVQLAELKQQTEAVRTPVGQQAYRVRAYLDNQWVSQGWLVPGRATTNANGQLAHEPVVVLDPSARTALTAAAPKVPAQAQPSSVTVNHNYPTTYDTVWPAIWVASGGGNHHRPPDPAPEVKPRYPTPPSPQPQPVTPFLSARIWQPQTGFQRMAPGRPGGDWISSSPRGHSYISSGAATGGLSGGGRTGAFPARY